MKEWYIILMIKYLNKIIVKLFYFSVIKMSFYNKKIINEDGSPFKNALNLDRFKKKNYDKYKDYSVFELAKLLNNDTKRKDKEAHT